MQIADYLLQFGRKKNEYTFTSSYWLLFFMTIGFQVGLLNDNSKTTGKFLGGKPLQVVLPSIWDIFETNNDRL